MIRPDKIISGMSGSVGFRQPFNSEYAIVNSENQLSASELFYQDASDFVSVENIIDCQSYSNISETDFNILLTRLQNDAVLKVCQKITSNESDLIQDINLYPYEKTFNNTIEPLSRFVGFKIEPNYINSKIINKIKWVELCLDSVVTFKLYLYNSNKPNTPIAEKEITTVANEAKIIQIDNWFIADDADYKSGYFYIGYFEDDLGSAKAIKKDYELSDYKVGTKYFYISPVTLTHTGSNIDVSSYTEESDTFGLNIGISVYNDYTELLISNKSLLYQAIQYQMGERILNLIRTSIRSNITERLNQEHINDISFDLYGNREAGIEGVTGKLKREINNIKNALFWKPAIRRNTMDYGRSFNHKI